MTPKQVKLIRFLLNQCGLSDELDKAEIVFEYTNGRSTSLKEMTQRETSALINVLNERLSPAKAKRDRQVSKILSMAHEMHWELQDGKVDMERLDVFFLTRTPQKKKLAEFTDAELPGLVTLFEKVYISFLKSL